MTERDAHCSKKREFCSETLWLNAASIDVNIFYLPAEVAKLLVEATSDSDSMTSYNKTLYSLDSTKV